MHWVMNTAFGEDQCRVRVGNAAQNFAVLRRIVMNLLKRDTTSKVGLKIHRPKACANDRYSLNSRAGMKNRNLNFSAIAL
jgi:hypothetical protein